MKKPIILLAFIVLAAGCVTSSKKHVIPDGFASYGETAKTKAVSPDGVMFRTRSEKNEPYAKLSFWKEALKKRMLDAGYGFRKESGISADGREGYLLELTAPLGPVDYSYLVAVFLNKKEIFIVESAGEITRFDNRREDVVAAIKKLRF